MSKYGKYWPSCQVFGDRPSLRYNTLEYRLMYSRSRIAVAELSLFNEKTTRVMETTVSKSVLCWEILLVLVWYRFRREVDAVKLSSGLKAYSSVSNGK